MTQKFAAIPSPKFLQTDMEAAEEVVQILKSNVDLAMEQGNVRAVLAYSVVTTLFSQALDTINAAKDLLDDAAGLLDAFEEFNADSIESQEGN